MARSQLDAAISQDRRRLKKGVLIAVDESTTAHALLRVARRSQQGPLQLIADLPVRGLLNLTDSEHVALLDEWLRRMNQGTRLQRDVDLIALGGA